MNYGLHQRRQLWLAERAHAAASNAAQCAKAVATYRDLAKAGNEFSRDFYAVATAIYRAALRFKAQVNSGKDNEAW